MPPPLDTDRIELHLYFMGNHYTLGAKFTEVPVKTTDDFIRIMHYFEVSMILQAQEAIAEHESEHEMGN